MSARRPSALRRLLRTPGGLVGAVLLAAVLAVAFLGPLLAPYEYDEIVGMSAQPPGYGSLLGTDYLGRDVWSRVLYGGRTVVLIGVLATALSYLFALAVGLYTGLRGGTQDFLVMRGVDLLTTIPAILYLLLLASGLGRHTWVLVLGMVIVLFPPVSRVIRTATLTVAKSGFVEAAQVRGDRTLTICLRDVLPSIMPNVLADFGIRFSSSILLVAAMNFLGLGLTPPAADWGLMTSENQSIIGLNVWAVIAPAGMLAVLTVSINLIADAYTSLLGSSATRGRRRRTLRQVQQTASPVVAGPARPVGVGQDPA